MSLSAFGSAPLSERSNSAGSRSRLFVEARRRSSCGVARSGISTLRMGKESRVKKSDSTVSGRGFGKPLRGAGPTEDAELDYMQERNQARDIDEKNRQEVDREEMESSADDPFEGVERRQRTTVLPKLSDEDLQLLRVPFSQDPAELLDDLIDAESDEEQLELIVANRHHLSFASLYNLTSRILANEQAILGDDDVGANLRTIRAKIIDACAVMDEPELKAAREADARVREVVSATNSAQLARLEADTQDARRVKWFWVVLYAAIAAWEVQASEGNPSPYQAQVYNRLVETLEAFLTNAKKQGDRLPKELVLLNTVFSAGAAQKRELLEDKEVADEQTLVQLCTLCCLVERLKFGAYRTLLGRLYDVRNFALRAQFGRAPAISPERFTPAKLPVTTSFDQFIRQNADLVQRAKAELGSSSPISTFGV